MRIGVKCNSYITMSHKILQRFWIHAGFRHIAAIRVPANMRRNIRHLYPIDIVVPFHHVVKAMFPIGDVSEADLRRVQIRETIRSHFEKEKELYSKGIKILSLFFIDEVAKYRKYDEDGNEINSEYGDIFEQEYTDILNEYSTDLM